MLSFVRGETKDRQNRLFKIQASLLESSSPDIDPIWVTTPLPKTHLPEPGPMRASEGFRERRLLRVDRNTVTFKALQIHK